MIYLVSNEQSLFHEEIFQKMTLEEAINEIESWDIVQFDTETSGRDAHICDLLCAQFGNKAADKQIVVDCRTQSITKFKHILETKELVGHNLKFDCQFLYKYSIIPTKVWDTMVVEQLLHLGFSNATFHYGLRDVALRRLGIDIDKTVRGQIIYRGLDCEVVKYAAGDVVYLEDIRQQQLAECVVKNCYVGAQVENNFVPVIAYLEWSGIKLDEEKWRQKMEEDSAKLASCLKTLDNWIMDKSKTDPTFKKYIYQDQQMDLFSGSVPEPVCTINWASSSQVIPIFKLLGFNTTAEDKKTGMNKDSAVEKVLAGQRGINDEFLDAYFAYKEVAKESSTYGQSYLDSVNPITKRIHTTFWQLGAASGRMSCGSTQENSDITKITHKKAIYPQLQNLPSDHRTRSCFVAESGNLFTSADYSALESRLGADIYNEPEMLREFLHGSGDMHSLCAKLVFYEELADVDVKDVKDKRPDLRKKVKPIEFSQQLSIQIG